jgi:ACS family tartrate transporter-like MFS transporter
MALQQPSGISPNHDLAIADSDAAIFAQRTSRRIARRLLPFLFVLYVIAFLDRMNVGAAALQMPRDLGLSDRAIGVGAGIFFFGYFLLEIPGALIAERWSARRWIARIMISWGILTVLLAFIHSARQFYVVRFLVGAAEAGFFPAVIVYLTHWFRAIDRAKAVAAFYAAMPLSYVIGSPLAGLLLGLSWLSLRGWRWLFILEGIPAILLGIVALLYLTDWPRQAHWLNADERNWITSTLSEEKESKQKVQSYTIWQALRQRDVILLSMCYFFAATGNYGIGFWLPSFLKRLSGESDAKVTLLAALPYIAGFLVQQFNGWHSDRTRERRWHAAIPLLLSGMFLFVAIHMGSSVLLSMLFFVGVGGAYFGFHPAFWPIPTEFLAESAAAASIGLINSVGNLGGFVGPFIVGYLLSRTHSFSAGLSFLVGSFLISTILMLLVRVRKRDIRT